MALTSIQNRLTPSVPLELTFGQQPIATGKKFTTIFGHFAASAGSGTPYQVYNVVNVGSSSAAKDEVDELAGVDSQIGKMAQAFIKANELGGFGNFSAFRVVLIPYNRSDFGPNDEALEAVKMLRSDLFVSCYSASNSTMTGKLKDLAQTISGIDRDLSGQFGSFAVFGSLDDLATQAAYEINSKYVLVGSLPDSNTAAVDIEGDTTLDTALIENIVQPDLTPTGDTTASSTTITNVDTTGVYVGASISGTGIPVDTTVEKVFSTSLVLSAAATATATGVSLTITNLPTAGIYPGAVLSGTGIPTGATVLSVTADTITMDDNATATGTGVAITVQNQVSQAVEIVAAAHAGGMAGSAFPYVPMQNVVCGGLIPPKKTSDWIQVDPAGSSETALVAGLSPLFVQPGNTVGFLRTRTTWVLNGTTPVTAYFDWQDLVVMNDFRENVYLITQNPPFNNNPGGTKASQPIAALLKDEILREAQFFEDQGAFQAVQSLADQFLVEPSQTSRGRFDFKIPVNVLPGLYVIAGNIQGVTSFDFTL